MADIDLLRDRDLNTIIAGLCRGAVREKATELAEQAEVKLASHRKTGEAHIEVTHGRVDSYVDLVSDAALSIEYGHGEYDQKRRRPGGSEYTIHVGASEGLHVLGGLIP